MRNDMPRDVVAFFSAIASSLASLAAASGNKAALADAHRAQNILNGDGDEEGNIVPEAPPAVAPQEAEMHVTLPKSETGPSEEKWASAPGADERTPHALVTVGSSENVAPGVIVPPAEDSSDEIPDVDLTVESDPPAPPTQTTPAVAPPAPEGSDKHSCSAPPAAPTEKS